MRVHIPTLSLVLAGALLAPESSLATCGAAAVCTQLPASFYGTVIIEGVVLGWETDRQNTEVTGYVLRRYRCGNPATCSELVAEIPASGGCMDPKSYSYTDYPPLPVEDWTYTLEVAKSGGRRACAIDRTPD